MFGFSKAQAQHFWLKVKTALYGFTFEKTEGESTQHQPIGTLELTQNKLKISFEDLKMISSALLFYRKQLTNKGELGKSEKIAELDRRLYDFIQEMEREQDIKSRLSDVQTLSA